MYSLSPQLSILDPFFIILKKLKFSQEKIQNMIETHQIPDLISSAQIVPERGRGSEFGVIAAQNVSKTYIPNPKMSERSSNLTSY